MTALGTRTASAALAAMVVVVMFTGLGVSSSLAAWTDQEYGRSSVASLDCAAATGLGSRATGRVLAGHLLGEDLDPVVALSGVTVANDGTGAVATPSSATASGTDAYRVPIDLSALDGAVSAQAGVTLPLDEGTGAYTQYAEAGSDGTSLGAAGAVTDGGAIDTGTGPDAPPGLGTLELSSLPYVGDPLDGLSGLGLQIGAIAATATLDGCDAAWNGGASASDVRRDYLVSSLEAGFTSAVVAELFGANGTVQTQASDVQSTVTALVGTDSTTGTAESGIATHALTGLTGAVTSAINGLTLGIVGLNIGTGSTSAASVDVDLSSVTALLTGTLSDGTVSVDLGTGVVTADLGALAGGLEGLSPNTELVGTHLADIATRVGALVSARVAEVEQALATALQSATVSVRATVDIGTTLLGNVAAVDAGWSGTLLQFLNGTETVTGPSVTALNLGFTSGLLGTVTSRLNALIGGVTSGVAASVVDQAYQPLLAQIGSAEDVIDPAVANIAPALGGALAALSGILSVTANVQPDQAPHPAAPSDAPQTGEWFESALRIAVLDRAGAGAQNLLDLYLASASAGPNG